MEKCKVINDVQYSLSSYQASKLQNNYYSVFTAIENWKNLCKANQRANSRAGLRLGTIVQWLYQAVPVKRLYLQTSVGISKFGDIPTSWTSRCFQKLELKILVSLECSLLTQSHF